MMFLKIRKLAVVQVFIMFWSMFYIQITGYLYSVFLVRFNLRKHLGRNVKYQNFNNHTLNSLFLGYQVENSSLLFWTFLWYECTYICTPKGIWKVGWKQLNCSSLYHQGVYCTGWEGQVNSFIRYNTKYRYN